MLSWGARHASDTDCFVFPHTVQHCQCTYAPITKRPQLSVDFDRIYTIKMRMITDRCATQLADEYRWSASLRLPRSPQAPRTFLLAANRIENRELRRGFARGCQREQRAQGLPVLPPCTWCGFPTVNFRDECTSRPAKAVCTNCEDEFEVCRDCIW